MLAQTLLSFIGILSVVLCTFGSADADKTAWKGADSFIVLLQDLPAALYDGGVASLEPAALAAAESGEKTRFDPESRAAQSYAGYLTQRQNSVIAAMQGRLRKPVTITQRYTHVLNGFAARLSPLEAAQTAGLQGVVSVHPDTRHYPDTDNGPIWIQANQVWDGSSTGVASEGERIVVGVIDSGVDFDCPSFADIGADNYNHSNPKGKTYGLCDPSNQGYEFGYCNALVSQRLVEQFQLFRAMPRLAFVGSIRNHLQ